MNRLVLAQKMTAQLGGKRRRVGGSVCDTVQRRSDVGNRYNRNIRRYNRNNSTYRYVCLKQYYVLNRILQQMGDSIPNDDLVGKAKY